MLRTGTRYRDWQGRIWEVKEAFRSGVVIIESWNDGEPIMSTMGSFTILERLDSGEYCYVASWA